MEFAQGFPPLYQVSPMKVMLHIANNPSPTLTNPQDFSKTFNHFLYASLLKDPRKRPTSHQMLEVRKQIFFSFKFFFF